MPNFSSEDRAYFAHMNYINSLKRAFSRGKISKDSENWLRKELCEVNQEISTLEEELKAKRLFRNRILRKLAYLDKVKEKE